MREEEGSVKGPTGCSSWTLGRRSSTTKATDFFGVLLKRIEFFPPGSARFRPKPSSLPGPSESLSGGRGRKGKDLEKVDAWGMVGTTPRLPYFCFIHRPEVSTTVSYVVFNVLLHFVERSLVLRS